tara:strand:- start:73 stop:342 length:270 start_codon:yes stop_codon:yes gene_type:complete
MIHLSYTGQGESLCGAGVDHEAPWDFKNGTLCDDCMKVAWLEQHRRNMLMSEIKKARKRLQKNGKAEAPKEPNMEPSVLYLSHYLGASE